MEDFQGNRFITKNVVGSDYKIKFQNRSEIESKEGFQALPHLSQCLGQYQSTTQETGVQKSVPRLFHALNALVTLTKMQAN